MVEEVVDSKKFEARGRYNIRTECNDVDELRLNWTSRGVEAVTGAGVAVPENLATLMDALAVPKKYVPRGHEAPV